MNMQAHRRRSKVCAAWDRIQEEVARIESERGVSRNDALSAVFADKDLLSKCHDVAGAPVPDPPVSSIKLQNG